MVKNTKMNFQIAKAQRLLEYIYTTLLPPIEVKYSLLTIQNTFFISE